MHDTSYEKEKFIIFAVDTDKQNINVKENLDELEELVKTWGGEVKDRLTQKRERISISHYLGKGKVEELKTLITVNNLDGVICDDELSNIQLKNLEEELDSKIMDRTMLILDIFVRNAHSPEGKLQVQLARLKYNASHLIGVRNNLSRQGGGGGTGAYNKGSGEKKIETDRRLIKDKIVELTKELKNVEISRQIQRDKRIRNAIPILAMVGYTNAGKSTLMNVLSDANVYTKDELFATLDTTIRKITLPNNLNILYSDTVGFINKLPHNLIKSFKSTLEELKYADMLVHVVDASSSTRDKQMEVVYSTLHEIGCSDKPIITVYNKIDKLSNDDDLQDDEKAIKTVKISAKLKIGIEKYLLTIEEVLKLFRKEIEVVIPYDKGNVINSIYGSCEIISEEHRENGTYFKLFVTSDISKKLEKFLI